MICVVYHAVLAEASGVTDGVRSSTTYDVRWMPAQGNLDGYVIYCNCTETDFWSCSDHSSGALPFWMSFYRCIGLTPGCRYLTHITTVRDGFENVTKIQENGTYTGKIYTFSFTAYSGQSLHKATPLSPSVVLASAHGTKYISHLICSLSESHILGILFCFFDQYPNICQTITSRP